MEGRGPAGHTRGSPQTLCDRTELSWLQHGQDGRGSEAKPGELGPAPGSLRCGWTQRVGLFEGSKTQNVYHVLLTRTNIIQIDLFVT